MRVRVRVLQAEECTQSAVNRIRLEIGGHFGGECRLASENIQLTVEQT
jgi:hypothetical protein